MRQGTGTSSDEQQRASCIDSVWEQEVKVDLEVDDDEQELENCKNQQIARILWNSESLQQLSEVEKPTENLSS